MGIKYSSPQAGDRPKRFEIRQAQKVKIIVTSMLNMAAMIILFIAKRLLLNKTQQTIFV